MRPRQARNLAVILTTVALLAIGFNNCGQRTRVSTRDPMLLANASIRGGGSTGGNPAMTTLRFSSYSAFGSATDPVGKTTGSDLSPPTTNFNQGLLSFFSICASVVQFYPADGTQPVERSLDRDMLVLPDGTPIADFKVPAGSYKGIVIKISDTCGTGRSFEFTNVTGTILSQMETSMAFAGNFRAGTRNIVLTLGISDIVSALSAATSEDAAKTGINLPSDVLPIGSGGEGGEGTAGDGPGGIPGGGAIIVGED